MNIRQLFDKFGTQSLKQKLAENGIDSTKIDTILSHVKIGMKFSETDLWISADFSSQ